MVAAIQICLDIETIITRGEISREMSNSIGQHRPRAVIVSKTKLVWEVEPSLNKLTMSQEIK